MVACIDKSALVTDDNYEVMSSVTIWLTEQVKKVKASHSVIFLVCFALLLAAHKSLSPFYIVLCLLCSVDIFIAYAVSFFCFSIFMINNDLYSVMIIL